MSWYYSGPVEAENGLGDDYCTISLNPFKYSPATEQILSPDQTLLSRSKLTYFGQNRHRPQHKDVYRRSNRSIDEHRYPHPTTSIHWRPTSATDKQPRLFPPRLFCVVCLGEFEIRELLRPTPSCTHEQVMCRSCLEEYVIHSIMADASTRVTCPSIGCDERLEYEDIIKHIGDNVECLNRFNDLIAQRHTVYVWRPCPECGQGQVHGNKEGPIVNCEYCRAQTCFTHGELWDQCAICEDDTTEEPPQNDNQVNDDYIAAHYKRCPNPSCGLPIEKISGCDHMRCYCSYEFCWECSADYAAIFQQGRHFHDTDCSHYVEAASTATGYESSVTSGSSITCRLPLICHIPRSPSPLSSTSSVPSPSPSPPPSPLPSPPPRSRIPLSPSVQNLALVRGYTRAHIRPPPNPGLRQPPSPPPPSSALPPFLLPENATPARCLKRKIVRLISRMSRQDD